VAHRVKFPLNEPAIGKKPLADRRVPGLLHRPRRQHLALATTTSSPPSTHCAPTGVEFLATPDSYYSDPELRARIGEVRVPIEELRSRGILVDRDEDGYLLQTSPSPSGTGPRCSSSHRAARFAGLRQSATSRRSSEAIEREQAKRGNF